MSNDQSERIDEVSEFYDPVEKADKIAKILFWFSATLSIVLLYFQKEMPSSIQNVSQITFVILVVAQFAISLTLKFHFMPIAESKRRKQLLSDSFGVTLTPEKTQSYYNNCFAPSLMRLAASVMENSFFGKEITGKMLVRERVIAIIFLVSWLSLVIDRFSGLPIIIFITQVVFSEHVLYQWVSLELLHRRHSQIYDQLYSHFFHKIGTDSPNGTAAVIDALVAYESAKSNAGIQLSSKIFNQLNPSLTKKWDTICAKLMTNEISDKK